MYRERLISLCERAIVSQEKWTNRDSAECQQQVGKAWALLKAGCAFKIDTELTNEWVIHLDFYVEGFLYFECATEENLDIVSAYLPTEQCLKKANARDWYRL
jgi:hypothetical protein